MPVVDQPSSLSLSGNLKDILVSGVTGPLSFTLSRNGVQVLNEVYQPNSQQIVQIKLKNLINELLEISVPSFMSDVYHQEKGYANFTAAVGAENITFRVVKAGVDIASVNASNFLASNFLTWQPQQKQVKYYDPEWLSYYSASATIVRVRGYFAGGTQQTITLATLAAGRLSTINVNYGHIRGKFVNQPLYYDVWTEVGSTRNSFIQRYILDTSCNDFDDVFVFENTLGGIDSVRFIGDKVNRDSYDVDSALYDEVNKEYFSEADRFIEKSTGYFKDDRARVWALEFFASAQRYHLSDGVLNRILVSKPTLESTKHQLNHFVFLFQSAKQTKYLNLPRAESLPANLEIIGPGDELFFLAPRLNEFAGITDLGNIIFPVQLPFEESWKKITFSQIADELTEIIQDRIPTPDLSVFYTKAEIDAMFEDNTHVESDTLQTVTNRGITTDKIIEPRGTRNQQLLSIPANAPLPEDIRPGENYIYVGPGSGAIPPEAFGNLEDLQNVASPIPVNKFLYKGPDGIWVGVDVPGQDLSAYASKVWVGDNFYSKEISDGLFVTQATDQFDMPGNKGWTGRHHFDGSLAIPSAAPVSPDVGKAYVWAGPGVTAGDPGGYELPIASSAQLGGIKIGTGMNIAGDGTVSVSVVSPSNLSLGTRTGEAMAILNSNGTGVMLPIATTGQAGLMSAGHFAKLNSLGLYSGTNGIEVNTSTRVISPNYGALANTIAQGNDSRIINGQTAFGWGNHAGKYVPLSRVISTSGHLTGGGQLNSNLTLTFRPLMDNYIVDTGNNSRIRFGSIAGNDDFQMRLAHATGAFVFRNGSNQAVAQIRYDGRPTFASMAGSGNRIVIVDASGNFTAPAAISHNGSITASEITGTNRVRIPTSRPASPVPGDIWIQ